MTPKWLIAEGPMPGRPSLLGQRIHVRAGVMIGMSLEYVGTVRHEDGSGVMIENEPDGGLVVPIAYPFNYQVVEDAPT